MRKFSCKSWKRKNKAFTIASGYYTDDGRKHFDRVMSEWGSYFRKGYKSKVVITRKGKVKWFKGASAFRSPIITPPQADLVLIPPKRLRGC